MPFRTRLLVFGYPALELITIGLLVKWIGLGWVLLILLAGIPVGFFVMRVAGRNAFTTMREASVSGSLPDGSAGLHGLAFAGGALIAIPGIWSKLIGLLLQLPPVQVLIARRFEGRFTVLRYGMRGEVVQGTVIKGDVVQGDVVAHNDEGPAEAGPPREIDPA